MKVSNLNGQRIISTYAFMLGGVPRAEVDTDQWKAIHRYVILAKEATKGPRFIEPVLGHVADYLLDCCAGLGSGGRYHTQQDFARFKRTARMRSVFRLLSSTIFSLYKHYY